MPGVELFDVVEFGVYRRTHASGVAADTVSLLDAAAHRAGLHRAGLHRAGLDRAGASAPDWIVPDWIAPDCSVPDYIVPHVAQTGPVVSAVARALPASRRAEIAT